MGGSLYLGHATRLRMGCWMLSSFSSQVKNEERAIQVLARVLSPRLWVVRT